MVLVRYRRTEEDENAIAGGLHNIAIVMMDGVNH
jgi:hypothetical protein